MDTRQKKAGAFAAAHGWPSCSWWVGLTRDQMRVALLPENEGNRIRNSWFGQRDVMSLARNMSEPKRKESIVGDDE